eukprot:m.173631 g.173631  ORF g.173631 m.173631 type:complete len:987 (+) comp13722_c0_seq1:147-3107(+)
MDCTVSRVKAFSLLAVVCWSVVDATIAAGQDQTVGTEGPICVYLGTHEYTQIEVPKDGSDERILDGVKKAYPDSVNVLGVSDVVLEYEGQRMTAMAGESLPTPGRYNFTGTVTLDPDGSASDVTSCFELTVIVVDIDECAEGRHTCGNAAECFNTVGSFECESQTESSGADSGCLHLGTQTYPQDEAPHDHEALAILSGDILRLFEDKRGLLSVKHRAKHYEGGQIHQKPGMYTLKETIEHSPDDVGRTITCVELTVVITDVDECTYTGKDPAFRAVCGHTTHCRNTDGSYTCECGMGMVANFDDSTVRDSCRFATDSRQCCGDHGGLVGSRTLQVYRDWVACTQAFECSDPCGEGHCVSESEHGTCTFTDPRQGGKVGGRARRCGCAEGYFGTGVSCGPNQKQDKRYYQEVYDQSGSMAWPETSPKPCGCQKLEMNPCWDNDTWGPGGTDPCAQLHNYHTVTNLTCFPESDTTVNACTSTVAGVDLPNGAKCCCAKGFVIDRLEDGQQICADPTPPRMTLNGDSVITINECDQFTDPSVTIHDDNKELYRRTRITSYDPPLRESCVTPGSYNATYQLVFRNAPPNKTRLIVVQPRDSCAVNLFEQDGTLADPSRFINPKSCPACGTNICVPEATCQGDGRNHYRCVCPPDMRGDGMWPKPSTDLTKRLRGFDSWWASNLPRSFAGGNGCTDDEAPELTLLGPSRVDIPLCSCEGCSGSTETGATCQRSEAAYVAEVNKALSQGSFCGNNPPCLTVTDNRDHEISAARVKVHTPRAIAGRKNGVTDWAVKYSVTDRSGNYAEQTRVFTFRELSLEEHMQGWESSGRGGSAGGGCNTAALQEQLNAQVTESNRLSQALKEANDRLTRLTQQQQQHNAQQQQAQQTVTADDPEVQRRLAEAEKVTAENKDLRDRFQAAETNAARLERELVAREQELEKARADAATARAAAAAGGGRTTVVDEDRHMSGKMTFIALVLGAFALRIAMQR